MKKVRFAMVVVCLVLILGLPCADAAVYFDDGGHHVINYNIDESVFVDYWTQQQPGTQVELVDNGSIGIGGGYVALYANAYSQITISGGLLKGNLNANAYSRVTVSGGAIVGSLSATTTSQVTISGGSIADELYASGSSLVTVSDGSIYGSLHAQNNGQLTFSGGSVRYELIVDGNSQVTVSGGTILKGLNASDSSRVTISGGSIGEGSPNDETIRSRLHEYCQVTISGGSIGNYVDVYNGGQLIVKGSDFAVDGSSIEYGTYYSNWSGNLTGTLANGDPIDNWIDVYNNGFVTFAVPEPCALSLLFLGGLMVRKRRV